MDGTDLVIRNMEWDIEGSILARQFVGKDEYLDFKDLVINVQIKHKPFYQI